MLHIWATWPQLFLALVYLADWLLSLLVEPVMLSQSVLWSIVTAFNCQNDEYGKSCRLLSACFFLQIIFSTLKMILNGKQQGRWRNTLKAAFLDKFEEESFNLLIKPSRLIESIVARFFVELVISLSNLGSEKKVMLPTKKIIII